MLEGDDTRNGAFTFFFRHHSVAFRQLMRPNPGEFAHFFSKKNANARGLARGAWAPLELTNALFNQDMFLMNHHPSPVVQNKMKLCNK